MPIENGRTDYRFEDDRALRPVARLRWECDEASGTLLADTSAAGVAFDGASDSTVWDVGRSGFDVSHVLVNGEKVSFGTNIDGTGLDSARAWEFSVWINVADLGFDQHVLTRSRNPTVWDAASRFVYVDATGKLGFYPGITANVNVITIAGTGWHHIRMRNQGGKLRLYCDGIVQYDAAWSLAADDLSYPLTLGAAVNTGYTNTLRIQTAEFRSL